MGKEWLSWGGGSGGGGGGGSTKRGKSGGERETPTGCMSAVFQLFDLHQFQFALHQQPSFKPESFLPEEPINLKGIEAPRNSLELEETFLGVSSLSSSIKEEKLNIPMGMQVKTRTDDLSSEFCSSPGTKSPNLVARLMGLDLLPETSSPNPPLKSSLKAEIRPRQLLQSLPNSIKNKNFSISNNISGTCSLPETPRISLARRSDVDYHRLSLQINKENTGVLSEEFEFSSYLSTKLGRRRDLKGGDDENRSPSQNAKQIVKQFKESVSRRVALDITNTVKNREQRRDEHLVSIKSKKSSNQSTPSSSPRIKNQNSQSSKLSLSVDNQSQCVKVCSNSKPKSQAVLGEKQQQKQKSVQKCKKISSEKYGPRLKKPPQTSDLIRNKQEEQFVRSSIANRANPTEKKCKKTALSNDVLNINVPALLPVKKDPSPTTARLLQKQQPQVFDALSSKTATLSGYLSQHSYNQEATHKPTVQDNSNNPRSNGTTNNAKGAEFHYISLILKSTGIDSNTPVSSTKWYSPSHPLDPSIFPHLELSPPTTTAAAAATTGKLMFQLVDELLVEILKPYINLKPWVRSIWHDFEVNASELIDKVCERIRSFSPKECQDLDDIDALISKDMGVTQMQRLVEMAVEEESEGIVMEMEREIMDTLVEETATVMWGKNIR